MTQLRILHVAEPNDYGVATCVGDLAADQVAHGWNVVVLAPAGGSLAPVLEAHGIAHRVWERKRALHAVPGDIRDVRAAIAAARPDVVHLHSSRAGIAGRLAVRGRVPTLFQPHAWSFFATGRRAASLLVAFERFAARWASVIICCSEHERQAALDREITGTFVVMRNAVDLDHFAFVPDSETARLRLGLASGPLAVCVGRISPQKGQHELVAAWRLVREEVAGAELVLVGDGPARAELESLAVDGVRFVGRQDDVRPWLASSDLVTMLSRYEGLSLAVLEAMATGRSVVVTAVQGMAEVVAAGEDAAGAVVPPGDVAAAANAIVERFRDPGRTAREGKLGRTLVEAHHDKRSWLASMRELTAAVARGR